MSDFSDLEAEDLDSFEQSDIDLTVKVLVIGNGHVGKSTYVKRFCRGKYDENYKKTIGCDYSEKRNFTLSNMNNKRIDFQVWDTAGQEEYRSLNHKYYSGAGCALLLFSTTDLNSFNELNKWKSKVLELCGNVPMAIVQTKIDASDNAAMTDIQIKSCVTDLNLQLFQCSSEQDININDPFEYLAQKYLEQKRKSGGNGESAQDIMSLSKQAHENENENEINGMDKVGPRSPGSGSGTLDSDTTPNESKTGTKEANVSSVASTISNTTNTSNNNVTPFFRIYKHRPMEPSKRRTNGKKDRQRQKDIDKWMIPLNVFKDKINKWYVKNGLPEKSNNDLEFTKLSHKYIQHQALLYQRLHEELHATKK